MNPKHVSGYSGALALRVVVDSNADAPFSWGTHQVLANEWQPLQYRDTPRLEPSLHEQQRNECD